MAQAAHKIQSAQKAQNAQKDTRSAKPRGELRRLPSLDRKKTPKQIKQSQLEAYRDLLLEKQSLRKRLEQVNAKVGGYNELFVIYMEQSIPVEAGPLTGVVKTVKGRRRVTKEHIDHELGRGTYTRLLSTVPEPEDKKVFEVLKRVDG